MEAAKNGTFVIALFDVLGFGERVLSSGLSRLVVAYDRLLDIVDVPRSGAMLHCAVPDGNGGRAAAFGYLDIQCERFSDTVLLWSPYSRFSFGPFVGMCTRFVCDVLHLGMPIRAGVAVGEAHMDKSRRVFLGKPVVEADRVEKAQGWIGVSFGPSFARKPFNEYFEPDAVLVYTAHRKPGYSKWVPGLVLDWPRHWRKTYTVSPEAHLSQMNTKPEYSKYYERAIHFCQFSRMNENWFASGKLSAPS